MNPSTKIFATLSLSAAVDKKINRLEECKHKQALGESLYAAGYEATGKYPYSTLSQKKISQIVEAVESLLSGPTEPQIILSMIIAGLVDIHAKCKLERKIIIYPVIYCAQACLDAYHVEIDHEKAFERYERWAA